MSLQQDIENKIYHIEVLTPKQNSQDLDGDLEKFVKKFNRVQEAGYVACITDNPMGLLSFQATDLIVELGLEVKPGQLSIHLNTFHSKSDLHAILDTAARLNVNDVLVVSGDGSERLCKLNPQSIGLSCHSVTAVELVAYIREAYPGVFTLGVAFNPYEPEEHEMEKMRRKIDAGAAFICTQPVLGRDERVLGLKQFGLPVFVECWMSKKLHLLSQCVGYTIPENSAYDPMATLKELKSIYSGYGMYLAMVGTKTHFPIDL
ncbi:MAG: methylenetetrahydrofolate reductase [bacterium]